MKLTTCGQTDTGDVAQTQMTLNPLLLQKQVLQLIVVADIDDSTPTTLEEINAKSLTVVTDEDDSTLHDYCGRHKCQITIRNALLVATDLLRLRRMYSAEVKMITAFTFPKLPVSQKSTKACVVKVLVTWEDFIMKYNC